MDLTMIQTIIQTLGFPIVMVGACAFFIWQMYKVQIADKQRLYEELSKCIAANKQFADIISTYTNKLDHIQKDVTEIKEKVGG